MSTQILATKLYFPPLRPASVLRAHLLQRLDQGLHRKLTLLSAPAGFGKTTLVSEWLAGERAGSKGFQARPVAWLSLDEGDNDPIRFLAYLVAALQTIAPHLGEGVLAVLHSPQPPPTESILTTLLNEITTIPHEFVLVLDDYHVIDASAIDQALTFLLEHLPPAMHLVITSREDPSLPLARYRARGQLTELRAADLRFTPAEAGEFLNQGMGLQLAADAIAALEIRTEGWIAGLQLAAISMQGQTDATGFIQSFTGSHRFVLDYLVEEVLLQQPQGVQAFLLHTSILDRLCGPLCDAVTGQAEGSARLEALERGNFFVVPLDDQRHWYRYHRLFADVLYTHLLAEQPNQVATLHQRASAWYAHNGSPAAAIRHALAAKDFARAADLIELAVPEMRRSRQEATALGWLKALPDELIRCRPVLSVGYAWALLTSGMLEGVEVRLRDAEQWLDTAAEKRERPKASSAEMVVVDEEEFRRLPGSIAVYRAAHAQARGDVADTVNYARRALELVSEDDHLWRGAAAALLGLAYRTSGDLEAAHRTYADGMARVQKAGHISGAIGCAIALADIRIAQGRLHEAMSTYERGLQLATEQGTPRLRGTADMYVGMSELYRERDDLNAASEHLLKSKELGDLAGLPQNPYRWCVAMARIREAHRDLDGALELLHAAERLYAGDFSPNVRPVAAFKTRVWIAQGRLGEALGWARERDLSAHDGLSYVREFEHITLARVLLALDKSGPAERCLLEAMELLERLRQAAEAGRRAGSAIEILVLQALSLQMQGDIPAALVPLERALTLAEPQGYIRMFVDEGEPMAQLLLAAAARGSMPEYTGKLLAEFEPALGAEQPRNAGRSSLRTSLDPQPLVEPLSQRELEVLRLFASELSGPEIADELVVALSTVRTHTKSIYSKLNVNSRRAAVKRAEELGLI